MPGTEFPWPPARLGNPERVWKVCLEKSGGLSARHVVGADLSSVVAALEADGS